MSSPLDGRSEAERRIIALAIQRIYQRRAAAKGGESGADFVARTKAQTAAQNPSALPGDQLEAEATGFWEPLVDPRTYQELAKLPGELVEEGRRHPVQSAFDRQAGLIKGMAKGAAGIGALAVSAADLLSPGPDGIPARIQAGATKGASVLGPVGEAVDATDRAAMAVINRIPGRDPNAATNLTMALSDEVGQAIDVNPLTVVKGVRALRAAKAAGASEDLAKAVAREAVKEGPDTVAKASVPATPPAKATAPVPAAGPAAPAVEMTPQRQAAIDFWTKELEAAKRSSRELAGKMALRRGDPADPYRVSIQRQNNALKALDELRSGDATVGPTFGAADDATAAKSTAAPPDTEGRIPTGTPTPAQSQATNSPEAVKQFFGDAAQGMRDGFIDSAWSRISTGKRLPFGDKPGTLESKLQAAADSGLLKTRDDVAAFVDQAVGTNSAPPAPPASAVATKPTAADNVVPFRRPDEAPEVAPPDAGRDWIKIANDLNQLDLKRRAALAAGEQVEPLPLEEIERLTTLIKRRADRLYAESREAGQTLSRAQRDSLYSTGRVQLTPEQESALQATREFRRKATAYEEAGVTLDDGQLQRLRAGDESNLLTKEQAKLWDDYNAPEPPRAPQIKHEVLGRVVRNFPETVEKFGDTGAEIGRRLRERDFRIASKTATDQQLIRDLKAQGLSGQQWDEVVDLLEAKLPVERYGQVDPRVMDTAMRIQNVLAEVDRDAVAAGVLKELPTGEKVLFQGLKNYYPHLLRRDDPDKAALDVLYRRFGTRNRSLTHVRYADEDGYLRGSDTPDALGTYLRTARVHIEDTKAMGNDVQAEIERLGEQLKREGFDGSYAKLGLQHTFGTGARPTRFAREFVGGINRLQASLSMGMSPLAQIGQVVSPIAKAGFAPVAREAVTLAKAIWSPAARQHIDEIARMGATTGDMLEHMIGEPVNSRFTSVLTKASIHLRAFAAEDEALRLISSGCGPDYLRDLVGALRGDAPWWKRIGDFRTRAKIAAQAEEEIRKMGIDVERVKAGQITPEDDARAGFYLSRVTQFGVRPQDAPTLAMTPSGKFFYLFKRYALNQSAMIVNEIAKPAMGGDLRPLARFIVAGSVVGAGTKTAQDLALDRENYLISKIKGEVPQESLPRFIAWSLAASQLGVFYSLLTMRPSGFAEFLAGKNLSDLARILDAGNYYANGAVSAATEGGAQGVVDWAAMEAEKVRSGEGRINRTVQRVAPIVKQVKEGVFQRGDDE